MSRQALAQADAASFNESIVGMIMAFTENFNSFTVLVPDHHGGGYTALGTVPVPAFITSTLSASTNTLHFHEPVTLSLDGVSVDGTYVGYITADGASVPVVQTSLGLVGIGYTGRPLAQYTVDHCPMPCFLAGTRIMTPDGEVPVENLSIGDLVTTRSGEARPIQWIGRRAFEADAVRMLRLVQPIRFAAGSLGQGLPKRDLWVSPEHCMAVDGHLVRAESLVNGASICRETAGQEIVYYHIELETHDVLIAEGAAAESYRDDRSQMLFDNQRPTDLPAAPTEPCLPVLEEGEKLAALRAVFEAASVQMMWLPEEGTFRFAIAPGIVAVRLRSEAQRVNGDARLLGVAISEIRVDGVPLALSADQLMAGWHAAEGGWRWTDGAGIVLVGGGRMLEVTVAAVPVEQRAAA